MSKINVIIGLEPRNNLLIRCKFVDRTPYLRVHDWWEYYGRFLQIKYKNRPEKWQEIKNLCFSKIEHPKNLLRHPLEPAEGSSMTQDGRYGRTDVPHGTDVRTLTSKEGSASPPPAAGAAAQPAREEMTEADFKELREKWKHLPRPTPLLRDDPITLLQLKAQKAIKP